MTVFEDTVKQFVVHLTDQTVNAYQIRWTKSSSNSTTYEACKSLSVSWGRETTPGITDINCVPKTSSVLLAITSSNLNRLSKFFHYARAHEICYKTYNIAHQTHKFSSTGRIRKIWQSYSQQHTGHFWGTQCRVAWRQLPTCIQTEEQCHTRHEPGVNCQRIQSLWALADDTGDVVWSLTDSMFEMVIPSILMVDVRLMTDSGELAWKLITC